MDLKMIVVEDRYLEVGFNSGLTVFVNIDFVLEAHRGFSFENILNKNIGRPSRRPVSIAACGMLNSRRGGDLSYQFAIVAA